nr:hypothetical protein BaRGS_021043 [Batillaria attramentaria]
MAARDHRPQVGVGSLFPFVSIYMKQLGLTSTETGIIYGTMPFVCFFVRPMVGAIADRWLKHKAVLIVCTLLTALLHLLIMLLGRSNVLASRYGQQRMWGTLGLAIFAITCTFVMNVMRDVNRTINYDVMFYFFAGLCTLSALLASFMTISTAARCQSIVKNACRLLVVPEVLVFLLVVMYLGMVSGTVEGFLFWYLTDLGAGPLVFGFCLVVNCAFEIPFFFFSGAIIERLGRMVCLYSAMFVLSVRLLAYSLLSNPWHVLFVETLHGVTFAVMWAAVTTHANSIAPAGMSASTQGLVGGMNFGIGKGLGSLLTGLLFDRVGARWTFRVYAVACLLLLVAYASFNSLIASSRGQKDKHHEVIIQGSGPIPARPYISSRSFPEYQASVAIWKYCPPVLLVLGGFGNVATIFVLRRINWGQSTQHVFLTALAVVDLLLLYTGLLRQWVKYEFDIDVRELGSAMCKIHTWLVYSLGSCSAWLLTAVTVQRAMSVVWPHRITSLCNATRSGVIVALILLASFALYSQNLFFVDIIDRGICYQIEGQSNVFR